MSNSNDLDWLGQMPEHQPGECNFTLHVDFLAKDGNDAICRAEIYTQALGMLRGEVDAEATWVSLRGDWSRPIPVYCREPGSDPMGVCLMLAGHPGPHSGSGPAGSWTDGVVPKAPDTVVGLCHRRTRRRRRAEGHGHVLLTGHRGYRQH